VSHNHLIKYGITSTSSRSLRSLGHPTRYAVCAPLMQNVRPGKCFERGSLR